MYLDHLNGSQISKFQCICNFAFKTDLPLKPILLVPRVVFLTELHCIETREQKSITCFCCFQIVEIIQYFLFQMFILPLKVKP